MTSCNYKLHGLTKRQQSKFEGKGGFNAKQWGPNLWNSLFMMILGTYPVKFDETNHNHKKIRQSFISLMLGLQYLLPCSFCRVSFKQFSKELPIRSFTDTRVNMVYWLYLMKDKVNKKLLKQELEYLNDNYKSFNLSKVSYEEYSRRAKLCFMTVPTPPFIEVLNHYEQHRATCSKKLKKCVAKTVK